MRIQARRKTTLALSLAGLAGCTGLPQAPLVYSSKVVFGADISGTSTENPGIGISVGYKSVDAAYVPVAVAGECDAEYCEYKVDPTGILVLEGTSSGVSKGDNQAIKAAGDLLALARVTLRDRMANLDSATQALASDQALAARIPELEAALIAARTEQQNAQAASAAAHQQPIPAPAADSAAAPVPTPDLTEIDKRLAAATAALEAATTAARDGAAAKARQPENEARRKNAEADRDAAQARVWQAEAELERVRYANTEHSTDAFSVFGSFSGASNVTVGEASLNIGKVFSTGVAAQKFTQALEIKFEAEKMQILANACITASASVADVGQARSDFLIRCLSQVR